ncbi:role in replication [Streptococcus dysgalactiae subsp. dysgalactiae]|nr:role in replication [Streptococcus dysgalactiae subsp. dysgalactiae]
MDVKTPQPGWVKEGFQKNYIVWLDNHIRVLMADLTPLTITNLKIGATGIVGGGFAGYGMYVLGYRGDFLDITNHRISQPKPSINNTTR